MNLSRFCWTVLILSIAPTLTLAQNINFERTYGGALTDITKSVVQTDDGGFIIGGWTQNFGDTLGDVYMLRTDAYGNELWSRGFGGPQDDGASDVLILSDNSYLFTGHTASFGSGECDKYYVKTDFEGDTIWTKSVGTYLDDVASNTIETSDNYLVSAGFMENLADTNFDATLLKMDLDGNIIWLKNFGGDGVDLGHHVVEADDGGYLLVGQTQSYGVDGIDIYLNKTDQNGNILWTQIYGGIGDDKVYKATPTSDGGFILTGSSSVSIGSDFDVYLLKISSAGIVEWEKQIGGTGEDIGFSTIETDDGEFICVGRSENPAGGGFDMYLNKLSAEGELVWTKFYGGNLDDYGYNLIKLENKGLALIGIKINALTGRPDCYLVRLDASILLSADNPEFTEITPDELTIWPNPCYGEISMRTSFNSAFKIISNTGQVVGSGILESGNTHSEDFSEYSPGIYTISVFHLGKIVTQRIVKN